jgi:hypothetical protein
LIASLLPHSLDDLTGSHVLSASTVAHYFHERREALLLRQHQQTRE